MEGYHISRKAASLGLTDFYQRLGQAAVKRRYQPLETLNRLASRCLDGHSAPEEEIDPGWGSCPLLVDDQCPIYPYRPFGCRLMMSKVDCSVGGVGEMDPWWVTLNNLFQQVIEQLDAGGFSGNLTDVLLYMQPAENRRFQTRWIQKF